MHRTRRALLASLLVALTTAFGYALAGVPNVELMTMSVFVAGYLLGAPTGAVVGGASIALHSIFNPFGPAPPPVFIAQIAGFAAIGLCGGIVGPLITAARSRVVAIALSGLVGLLLTLTYDVLTNLGAFVLVTDERTLPNLWKFVLGGVAFTAMHLVWNTGLFLATLRPVLAVLTHYREELT